MHDRGTFGLQECPPRDDRQCAVGDDEAEHPRAEERDACGGAHRGGRGDEDRDLVEPSVMSEIQAIAHKEANWINLGAKEAIHENRS